MSQPASNMRQTNDGSEAVAQLTGRAGGKHIEETFQDRRWTSEVETIRFGRVSAESSAL